MRWLDGHEFGYTVGVGDGQGVNHLEEVKGY